MKSGKEKSKRRCATLHFHREWVHSNVHSLVIFAEIDEHLLTLKLFFHSVFLELRNVCILLNVWQVSEMLLTDQQRKHTNKSTKREREIEKIACTFTSNDSVVEKLT